MTDVYEINHIWTAEMKWNEEWSSQSWTHFMQLRKEAWKNAGLKRYKCYIGIRKTLQLRFGPHMINDPTQRKRKFPHTEQTSCWWKERPRVWVLILCAVLSPAFTTQATFHPNWTDTVKGLTSLKTITFWTSNLVWDRTPLTVGIPKFRPLWEPISLFLFNLPV